jgi:hypothetical protein
MYSVQCKVCNVCHSVKINRHARKQGNMNYDEEKCKFI